MKNIKYFFLVFLLFSIVISLSNCGKWISKTAQKAGAGATQGMLEKLDVDTLAYHITKNAELGIADTVARKKLQVALDSILNSVGKSVHGQVDLLVKDTLIKKQLQAIVAGVKDTLLSKKTTAQLQNIIAAVREDAIGTQTQNELKTLTGAVIGKALGDSTQIAITNIKNILLGNSTKNQLSAIVAAAIDTLTIHYNKGLAKTLNNQVTFFTDKGLLLLLAITLGLLLIIGFVWYKKHQQLELLNQIMLEIHKMPSRENYDELTGRINDNVSNKELLNTLLKKQDIYGEEAWQRRMKKANNTPK